MVSIDVYTSEQVGAIRPAVNRAETGTDTSQFREAGMETTESQPIGSGSRPATPFRCACDGAAVALVLAGLLAGAEWGAVAHAAGAENKPAISTPRDHEDPVLIVGGHDFSRRDIALRQWQIRWKYGDVEKEERTRRAAYSQLVIGYVLAELLRREGHPISEVELSAELARIDESTKRPQQLEELKKLYGSDPGKYATIAILPDYANRRYFFEVFPELDHVQAPLRKRAEQRLDALESRDGASLGAATESGSDWRHRRSLFHPERGFLRLPEGASLDEPGSEFGRRLDEWKAREAGGESLALHQRLEREVFSQLDPGTIFPQVIEFDRSFAIMRPLGWHDEEAGVRIIESLSLPKIGPHEYLWRQAGDIEVWVEDDSIRRALFEQKPKFKRFAWRESAP